MSWTEQLEARAVEMRQRAGRAASELQWAEIREALRLIPAPQILDVEVPRPKVSKPIKSARRLQALLDNGARQRATRMRQARLRSQVTTEVPVLPGGSRRIASELYPQCPFCNAETIRAGKVKGEQRFRCKTCRRTFYSAAIIRPVDAMVTLTCNRCGSTNCLHKGCAQREASGLKGYCNECRKTFTQGGRYHLNNSLSVLLSRVRALPVPQEMKADIYAEAAVGVLQGLGYTWDIHLNTTDSAERLYKAYGDQGDAHPAISGQPRRREDY